MSYSGQDVYLFSFKNALRTDIGKKKMLKACMHVNRTFILDRTFIKFKYFAIQDFHFGQDFYSGH